MNPKSNQKLRVLFITRAYGETGGGMERLSYELIEAFSNRSDTSVNVLANHTKAGRSLTFVRLRSTLFAFLVIPRALVVARHVDVVHLGDPVLSLAGWLIQRIWKKPVAVTVHGLDVTYEHILYTVYLRLFFRNFDAYIPISDYAKKMLARASIKGKVFVIPPGIKDRFYNPSYRKEQLSAMLRRDIEGKIVLLTSGRLVARKGHEWFIRSVLPRVGDNVFYVIAGDGPQRHAIQKSVQETAMENKVVQLGRVDNDALKLLYNTVDAFIQPNIPVQGDAEGFGIVLAEAATCARPIFAANLEGIPQVVHEGKNGRLLPPGDAAAWTQALKDFITSPYKATDAREYTLQQFSWERISSQYRAILADVTGARR